MMEHLEEKLAIIREKNPILNAFISVYEDYAREQAKKNIEGPLSGMVFGIKDNIAVKGMKLTCASSILRDYVSPFSATVVERLERAGAIIVGKTNMDEFACGSSGETSYFGPTRNPHDLERVPGGSSSGSAVAVAADMVDASLGSDTGGSIRNPASFTGIYGFKPTYNLVSRYGLVDLAMSLDTIGPFAKDVDTLIAIMDVINGPDGRDAGVKRRLNFRETANNMKIDGIRVGWSEEFLIGVDEPIERAYNRFVDEISSHVDIVEVKLPPIHKIWPLYYLIVYPEFASAMQRYNGLVFGEREDGDSLYNVVANTRGRHLGKEVKRRIILGTYLSMEKYEKSFHEKALRLREQLTCSMKKVFKEVDFLLSPTVPFLPFKLGERINDPVKMYASDALTVLANLVGIPALNVPWDREGNLPIGMQIMGRWFEDDKLLAFTREVGL